MDIDLVICVFGCDLLLNYREQIETINNTWGSICNNFSNIKLLFFLGETITDASLHGPNYIRLDGVKDDYLSASYKQFLGLKYIYENFTPKFVFCCGTDTYINIPKMISYIKKYNHNNLYIGGDHEWYRQIGEYNIRFHAGGAGFLISYYCLEKLYPLLEKLMDNWIEVCDRNKIEYLKPACDISISYYIHIYNKECEMIIDKEAHFFDVDYKLAFVWSGNKYSSIITCHRMTIEDFYCFTGILNENNFYM